MSRRKKELFRARIVGADLGGVENHVRVPKAFGSLKVIAKNECDVMEYLEPGASPGQNIPMNLLAIRNGNNALQEFWINNHHGKTTKDIFVKIRPSQELIIIGYERKRTDEEMEIPLKMETAWMGEKALQKYLGEILDEEGMERYQKATSNDFS